MPETAPDVSYYLLTTKDVWLAKFGFQDLPMYYNLWMALQDPDDPKGPCFSHPLGGEGGGGGFMKLMQ